ncbi:MAG: hypothetical protein HC919_13880 [Oscillatoriales cyanobacterium SM2_2_1]|nr:hypothetical protein [Oscillatoriales cyanobacterium SM2_2_1]
MNLQTTISSGLATLASTALAASSAIAQSPQCSGINGTYRNHRGELAYIGRLHSPNEPANYTSLELILPSESPRPLISTGFYIPSGYGTPTLKKPDYSLAFILLNRWRVAVLHEGPLLWYEAPQRIGRENSLWFQVLCDRHDAAAAARVSLPTLSPAP